MEENEVKVICNRSLSGECKHGTCGHRWRHKPISPCMEATCQGMGENVNCVSITEEELETALSEIGV